MSAAILFKIFIVTVLMLIAFSLMSGLFFLVKDDSSSNRLVTSLTFRIVLSILLFVSLIVGYKFGWIQPHGPGF
ncbi:MAG: twin transmembrane helix small protein [Proteobacteria bacterium]|nr:twin transmembrane helix small protein [Pseudomonadota bacterium]